jgi:BirA family biotin operon repressor/biotin-[acetyl-CoA-carboxylase] ligase
MPGERANVVWDVRRYDELDSTNRLVMDLAREGVPEGLVVVADHQTAGRGRRGRAWEAPPGASLLVSILFRPGAFLPPGRSHLLTAAVALAAADACAEVAGLRPGVKWPNDLVVEQPDGLRKLAGVLAEGNLAGDTLGFVVVGLGLNLNWPDTLPAELAEIAVAANHVVGHPVDRDALLDAMLSGVSDRYGRLADGARWRDVAEEYRAACWTLGSTVQVDLGGETIVGTATTISDDGLLGVDDGTQVRWVAVGDVTHVRRVP